MSRIEDALKKLRGAAPPSIGGAAGTTAAAESSRAAHRVAVPIARKKKVAVEGEKHHISPDDLMRAGLLAPLDQAVAVADEFRRIKRPLIANALRTEGAVAQHNVIMVASGLPGAGKTFCSINLAVSISLERELNVLLVDADVAKPHISRAFGLQDAPGLIDLLQDEAGSIADVLVRTDLNDIQVLPAGRRHPQATELLASDRMSKVMKELATRYRDRIVLLDSPPLLITSEAHALATQVGQIALVVEAGQTTKQSLYQTIETLPADKAINIVLNKARGWGRSGAYYGEYETYGYEDR
jgi:exopolysaccharide/PEP-CTERM locus tyrosine autokinase